MRRLSSRSILNSSRLGGIILRDEAAVVRLQREIGPERAAQQIDQGAVLAEVALGRAHLPRRKREPVAPQHGAEPRGFAERVAQRGEIARAAAAEREALQRPRNVGAAPQRRAQVLAQPLGAEEELDRVEPVGDRARVGEGRREPLGEQPRSGPRDGPVDGGEEAAAALAGESLRQLEIAPCRGVDLHHGAGRSRRGVPRRGSRPCCVSST